MPGSADDEATFTDLFRRHRDGVHAFLLGRTSDPDAALDLLQETFLRVWRNLDEVVALAEGRQRAWIFTVTSNLVIDRYRARAMQRATVSAMVHEAGVPGPTDAHVGTAAQVALRDQLALLAEAIAGLPEDQQVILRMAAMAGMTSSQIGEALDLPAGTVRYKLHRARNRLTRQLEG